jgi:hypothetical protein
MARSSTGRSVARAGATGGGRTYRGQTPVNWYAALVVIVILGVGSVVYARYEYQNPAKAPVVPPAVGTTWYAGFSFDICGTQETSPSANPNGAATVGMSTTGNGVIQIAPVTASQAGNNATLGRFVTSYPGMLLTATSIRSPGGLKYTNGDKCPAGTPDAGKAGQVTVVYWTTVVSTASQPAPNPPGDLKLGMNSLVTMAFVPAGTKVPKPNETTVAAVLQAASTPTTTTTTGASTTSTTAP